MSHRFRENNNNEKKSWVQKYFGSKKISGSTFFGSKRSWILDFFDPKILLKRRDQVDYLTVKNTLSPVGTWKTWNSTVAMLSLTFIRLSVA